MLDFILENYYVILVICILLIFAIIGYIVDTLKTRQYKENVNEVDAYIPEEEVFIQRFEEQTQVEEEEKESVDDLLKEYNNENDETTQNY